MERTNKKHVFSLGVRVGIVFLVTVAAVIIVAYYALSKNFQSLMTDYTLKLVAAMTEQGVQMVENELDTGRQEASFLADAFKVPASEGEEVIFPQSYTKGSHLRMVYVTQKGTAASDGRQRDISTRQDVRTAFAGETAVYGPYFNEEDEFVVCYTAPIKQDGNIVGVLSVEKDGYRFCELIKNIRFINSGESYIIDENGTDIAVSDQNHIEWVNTQYNAQKLYEEKADEETKAIIELEKKGLNGETGLDTYYWKEGLVYVYYKPVSSVGWVLLAGLREEEVVSMTRSALFATVLEKPIMGICLFLVFLLTALIMYWIISSMKKNAEINEKLNIIANYDSLTGLMNRNSYSIAIDKNSKEECRFAACVYIDVNGLHEINNHLGHQAGDEMLIAVADALRHAFPVDDIYRIGGDEFVVLCRGQSKQDIYNVMEEVKQSLRNCNYEISVGIAWKDSNTNTIGMINEAESAMQMDKKQFYESNGNERRGRNMNEKSVQ